MYCRHKTLRKLMTPAFTVSYLDKLDVLFQKPVQDMMDEYMRRMYTNCSYERFEVNLMNDLHRMALEM
jgi:hypothetical protein